MISKENKETHPHLNYSLKRKFSKTNESSINIVTTLISKENKHFVAFLKVIAVAHQRSQSRNKRICDIGKVQTHFNQKFPIYDDNALNL